MHISDQFIDDLSFERAARVVAPDAAPQEVIFFDIETTGLSPSRSGLYLIGCMFAEENRTQLRQFFADDLEDEKRVLKAFAKLLEDKSNIVHFNGSTFDIPYLKTKYGQHGMSDPFYSKKSCDIYKKLMPLKRILSLGSMKQKKLEELCGIYREDVYTGGELIDVYKNYQKSILMCRAMGRNEENEDTVLMRNTLLLHNSDDIKGMMPVAGLLSIVSFFSGGFDVGEPREEDGGIRIEVEPRNEMPECMFKGRSPLGILSRDENGKLTVKVPLIKDKLRLFMKDFREHYYIPSKDMAVHVSVGEFMNSHDRKKATPATCYVPCEGKFLTIREEDLPEGLPLIKRDYYDKLSFVRLQDISPDVIKAAVIYRMSSSDE
ncbi:MAG: ribonuclease H-like domain-containing protein [Lachnospiraceae bacterium]|nr:ribonuclease H-like domain-containing protein [Lachnospiraceae bacterium]